MSGRRTHAPCTGRGSRRAFSHRAFPLRAFSLLELLLVVGVIGVFAGLVIPGFADASRPLGEPVCQTLEADLRRARTEAMVRSESVVAVADAKGGAWWLGLARSPGVALDGTRRQLGSGGLSAAKRAHLVVKTDAAGNTDETDYIVFARFDTLGARDESTTVFELRDEDGRAAGRWTMNAGRTRLER